MFYSVGTLEGSRAPGIFRHNDKNYLKSNGCRKL